MNRRWGPRKKVSMSAQAHSVPPAGPSITVRRAKIEDAPVCGRVCYDAFYKISTDHGFPSNFPSPKAAVGLLSEMFSHPGFYCVVAESDLQALIASAEAFAGPGSWCLENGLLVVQPMTLMSSGLYNEPAGAYLPSVLF
jgi:hypothetical protein